MSDTPTEPAADAPAKVYICPACGARYDVPTECANGHPPTATIEYDRATVEAADSGDPEAQAAIAETATAAGNAAGAVEGETSVAPPVEGFQPATAPPAADPAGDQPGTGTPPGGMTDTPNPTPAPAPVEPVPVEPAPPADVPAPPADVTDISTSPAAAPAVDVTVIVSGVTYSGTIPAA